MDIIYRYDPYKAIEGRRLEGSAGAIDLLERGHRRFMTIVTQVQKELVGDHSTHQVIIPSDPLALGFPLGSGAAAVQSPFALMLGCSDARVPIEQIFDQSPNDLFVIRVAGNVLGVECLGSIDYAVNQFGDGLKLLVVLGHSTCGAVSAAVDSYLAPKDYASIAFTHALRSLVDRIQVAVRGAATALERVQGTGTSRHPSYRAALVETAVYLNAAITAYDVRRELDRSPRTPARESSTACSTWSSNGSELTRPAARRTPPMRSPSSPTSPMARPPSTSSATHWHGRSSRNGSRTTPPHRHRTGCTAHQP